MTFPLLYNVLWLDINVSMRRIDSACAHTELYFIAKEQDLEFV